MTERRIEPLWHIELAIIVAIVLQIVLADGLTVGPKYLLAVMELLLLFGLRLTAPVVHNAAEQFRRFTGLLLTGIVSFVNITSLFLVCRHLLNGDPSTGKQLIVSALAIYLTNIIVFGLWYWQLDGGGPGGRGTHRPPVDFLFPQMNTSTKITEEPNWQPTFMDYLFVSITNGTAFSPTDSLPLTHRAKLLMSIQALVSLSTVALVGARAINILA
ncbi:MAG TPA: hypothetical protein VLF39_01935 [Candidatus Saccharimonadales bacterium]|nr:hypothetical protein [Candidatus Saccharimonadales bacterium]